MKKGIIILATGHAFYGRMAYNACISIKATDKEFHVALVYDHSAISHLSHRQRAIFDFMIPVAETGFAGKLGLDLVTPFEETVFIDADTVWLPNKSPHALFESIPECAFTGHHRRLLRYGDDGYIAGQYQVLFLGKAGRNKGSVRHNSR